MNKPITPVSLNLDLADYFPDKTVYFYAFPSGLESRFYNAVPPTVEELVAARPLVCTKRLSVITFAATSKPLIRQLLVEECGVDLLPSEKVITLDEAISAQVSGVKRNERIKDNLSRLMSARQLIMAQPFLDKNLRPIFQIPPTLTNWLNDKVNLPALVPAEHVPKRYATMPDGAAFASADPTDFTFPCVVKFTSSSSGDGVRVCHDHEQFQQAQTAFRSLVGQIVIDEYINVVKNYCVQFAIPYATDKTIEIVGYNEQLTAPSGEFLSGVVRPPTVVVPDYLKNIFTMLSSKILPAVRARGWYGAGGMDVLVDASNHWYFVDANFRLTATFAFVTRSRNMGLKKSLLTFIGSFTGSLSQFKTAALTKAKSGDASQLLEMVSLSNYNQQWNFNAGMLFDQPESIAANASDLLQLGIRSSVLEKLAQQK